MSSAHLLLLLSKKPKQNYCFVFWVIYYSLQLEHQVSSLSKRQHKSVGYIFLLRKTGWSPRQWMNRRALQALHLAQVNLLGRTHKCLPPCFIPSAQHRSQATGAAGVTESQLLGRGPGAPPWAGRPQDTEEPAARVVGPAVHRACQWTWPLKPAQFQVKQYSVFALISLANFPSADEMCRGACCALWWSHALFAEVLIWKMSTASFLSMFFKIGVHLLWCCIQWLSIEILCCAEIVTKEEIFVSTHAIIHVLRIYFGSAKLVWSWMASLVYL